MNPQVLPLTSTTWAASFEAAFHAIDPMVLGRVRFVHAVALGPDFFAVIHHDHFGRLAGRIYSVSTLDEGLPPGGSKEAVAGGFILGDLIEPSPPGKDPDHQRLEHLNGQFPGIKFSGDFDFSG